MTGCSRRWCRSCARAGGGRYRDSLARAGYHVRQASIGYTAELDLEHPVGGLYSAFPASQLPPPQKRPAFAEQVRQAIEPHAPFTEHVRVAMLLARNG